MNYKTATKAVEALGRLVGKAFLWFGSKEEEIQADYETVKAALEELESIKDNLISKRASIQPNWLVKARQEEIAELKAEIARLNQELKVASEPSVIYIDEPPIEKRIRISKEQLNNQAKGNSLQQGVQETDVGAWIDRCHELGMLAKEQKAEITRLKALLDDGRVKLDDN